MYAATKWVAEHGHEIGLDGKTLAVAGNSAGGKPGNSRGTAGQANRNTSVKFQLLFWAVTNADLRRIYIRFADSRVLTKI